MKITIATTKSGDWSALYFDGKIYAEGHNIRLHELLDGLILKNRPVSSWNQIELEDEEVEMNGMPLEL